MSGIRTWEIALICAVVVTALWSAVLGQTPCCAWWGTVYPDLTPAGGAAQAASLPGGGGVVLRFHLLEWVSACLRALRLL